jgi:hypothetical protein
MSLKSIVVSYANRYSVGGKARNDMEIGLETGLVGSNSLNMINVSPDTLVLIRCGSHRLIMVCKITGPGSETDKLAWKQRGGKKWNHVYKMEPLTSICKITKNLKIIVNELTLGKDDAFWHPINHSSNPHFPQVVSRLIDELS